MSDRTRLIDRIGEAMETPHIGAESEGIMVDRRTLEIVHRIGNQQPTQAVRAILQELMGEDEFDASEFVCPDIPETTVEWNPPPVTTPKAAAALQRVYGVVVDRVCRILSARHGLDLQLLHGACWRPPNLTAADVTRDGDFFKRCYYESQIQHLGDGVGSAAGDHLNLSAPWLIGSDDVVTDVMIKMAGKLRLIGGALSIALSASCPLFFGIQNGQTYTKLTRMHSVRLGEVWPGRDVKDIAPLFQGRESFRRCLKEWAKLGELKSGRDLYIPVRAQPGVIRLDRSFKEACDTLGFDLKTEHEALRVHLLLMDVFSGKQSFDEVHRGIGSWHRGLLDTYIQAPRNRVELRTFETPVCTEEYTPYELIRDHYTFFTLLFYLMLIGGTNGLADLHYDDFQLQMAKRNEWAAIDSGMDARFQWPHTGNKSAARQAIAEVLTSVRDLAGDLGMDAPLSLIERVVQGSVLPPARSVRKMVLDVHGITGHSTTAVFLPNDDVPHAILDGWRSGMDKELEQIKGDLGGFREVDRRKIEEVLGVIERAEEVLRSAES